MNIDPGFDPERLFDKIVSTANAVMLLAAIAGVAVVAYLILRS